MAAKRRDFTRIFSVDPFIIIKIRARKNEEDHFNNVGNVDGNGFV